MKNILITGSAGNLGKAAIEKFIDKGYRVLATVSPGKALGFEVAGPLEVYEADLAHEESTAAMVSQIISKHKTIDTALLLVGGFSMGTIFETDQSVLRKMFSLNFETAYFAARPVFIQMLKQEEGGRLVFVGARPGLDAKAGKNMMAYSLSKSLVFRLAELLNAEAGDQNVTASVIVPSVVDTAANREFMPTANFSSWVTPEAIAEIIAFITSSQAVPIRESVVKIYGDA